MLCHQEWNDARIGRLSPHLAFAKVQNIYKWPAQYDNGSILRQHTEVCQITVIAESDLRHSRVRVEHAGTVMRLVVTVDACELESSFCFVCCVAPEREWADTVRKLKFHELVVCMYSSPGLFTFFMFKLHGIKNSVGEKKHRKQSQYVPQCITLNIVCGKKKNLVPITSLSKGHWGHSKLGKVWFGYFGATAAAIAPSARKRFMIVGCQRSQKCATRSRWSPEIHPGV